MKESKGRVKSKGSNRFELEKLDKCGHSLPLPGSALKSPAHGNISEPIHHLLPSAFHLKFADNHELHEYFCHHMAYRHSKDLMKNYS